MAVGDFKSVNDIKKARDKADKAKRDKAKRDGEAVRKQNKNKKRKKQLYEAVGAVLRASMAIIIYLILQLYSPLINQIRGGHTND